MEFSETDEDDNIEDEGKSGNPDTYEDINIELPDYYYADFSD